MGINTISQKNFPVNALVPHGKLQQGYEVQNDNEVVFNADSSTVEFLAQRDRDTGLFDLTMIHEKGTQSLRGLSDQKLIKTIFKMLSLNHYNSKTIAKDFSDLEKLHIRISVQNAKKTYNGLNVCFFKVLSCAVQIGGAGFAFGQGLSNPVSKATLKMTAGIGQGLGIPGDIFEKSHESKRQELMGQKGLLDSDKQSSDQAKSTEEQRGEKMMQQLQQIIEQEHQTKTRVAPAA